MLALFTPLLIAACGTPATVPEDRFYRLSLPAPIPQVPPVLDRRLIVGPIATYDVYRDRAIAYSPSEDPGALQHHHYHFWIAPPPELIREQLVDYLRETGIATEVSTVAIGSGRQTVRLAVRLTRFERQLQADGDVRFVIGLDVALDDNGQVLLRQRYTDTTAASDGSFPATVRAADAGLAKVFATLVEAIGASLDGPQP